MAYNPNAPADTQFLADFPAEQREQQRALKEDKIVDAGRLNGLNSGNASGNIPVSNGTKCVNLNADKLDGHDEDYFSVVGHVHNTATQSSDGFMSNTDKAKLDGIATGAEANQNAFSNVKVGSTTIQADAKQDTLELTAGTNITLTPDQTNDKVTIAAPDVLPLAGGTMAGNISISKSGPVLYLNNSDVTRNSAPSADKSSIISFRDNNGTNMLGMVQNIYYTTKQNIIRLIAYKGTTTDSTWTSLSVGYDGSGNWFTYAPTPAAGDNSTKIATTAFVHNYLPLAGGTMTGNIAFSAGDKRIYGTSGTSSSVSMLAGSDVDDGAGVSVNHKNRSNGKGYFSIWASNGTNKTILSGTPDGTLTWNSKEVERVNTIGANFVRFESGLQICWGEITSITSTWKTVTYPNAFKSDTYPQVSIGQKARCYFSLNDVAYNNFKIRTDQTTEYTSCYVAVGRWK